MMFDESRLRDLIESRTVKVGDAEHRLWLVGFSTTPSNGAMLAIAISGTDERLQLQLSDNLRRDPIALRQRVVYFAKRILNATRLSVQSGSASVATLPRTAEAGQ